MFTGFTNVAASGRLETHVMSSGPASCKLNFTRNHWCRINTKIWLKLGKRFSRWGTYAAVHVLRHLMQNNWRVDEPTRRNNFYWLHCRMVFAHYGQLNWSRSLTPSPWKFLISCNTIMRVSHMWTQELCRRPAKRNWEDLVVWSYECNCWGNVAAYEIEVGRWMVNV